MIHAASAVFPRDRPSELALFAFRASFTASFGLAASGVGYAWVRVVETLMFPRADPRAIVAVTQGGYVTRCAVALVVGGMGAFAGWALTSRPERAARALVGAVALAITAIALQTGLAP